MINSAQKRLMRELLDLKKNPIPGIAIEYDEEDMFSIKARIDGPPNSAYEEGIFELQMDFTTNYPHSPPEVKFTHNVFHPNVSEGDICLDILQSSAWSPALKIGQLLLSISSFLVDPCPENGFGNEATELLLMGSKQEFNDKVKETIYESGRVKKPIETKTEEPPKQEETQKQDQQESQPQQLEQQEQSIAEKETQQQLEQQQQS